MKRLNHVLFVLRIISCRGILSTSGQALLDNVSGTADKENPFTPSSQKLETRELQVTIDLLKIRRVANRRLLDSGEHQAAGETVSLPGLRAYGEVTNGAENIFNTNTPDDVTFGFGNLTYLAGDVIGPHKSTLVICNADSWYARKEAAQKMRAMFDDKDLVNTKRIDRASKGMQMERDEAAKTNEIFQKHVAVHTFSFSEFDKIDDMDEINYLECGLSDTTATKNTACMLTNNLDHFGKCARKTYQIFHDLALEEAESGNLANAYFYEGIASHPLTDLFSAGHIRTPSKTLRTSHCSPYRGSMATNQMHDEDSYNGILMTNRMETKTWWVFGDSFYFEPFNKDNRDMMHTALQESVNEVYEAYQSKTLTQGHSKKNSNNFPGKALDYVPDLEVSKTHVPDYWDVNTCPLWYEEGGEMFRRLPWYRLRSQKGRMMGDQQPSSNKFGLFDSSFPLVDDVNQLKVSGTIDKKLGDCWYRLSPETSIYSDECGVFGNWQQEDMFYSPEAAGFMPPTFATCNAYSREKPFDNDCYDVLELVSKGQNCYDLKNAEVCNMLEPRCTWNFSAETCVQGSCVAFSQDAGDIVLGDPTPSVPQVPSGFYMSFQGACAFNTLEPNHYKKMQGTYINAEKCAQLCINYADSEKPCTGIAIDNGRIGDCYLYFEDACQRADSPGFMRCPSHSLQAFHKGTKEITEIMSNCECSKDWYYKDPATRYSDCESVQSESWGSWCYLENPGECEIGMYSSTQQDQKWRYCKESTCEKYDCPNGLKRRDSVICYDDRCDVYDCCEDPPKICVNMYSPIDCQNIGCTWVDSITSPSCVKLTTCENSLLKEECQRRGCAFQDGKIHDSCEIGICDNWYNKKECEHWGCKWESDTCSDTTCEKSLPKEECQRRGCAFQDGKIYDSCEIGICDNWYNKEECVMGGCKWNNNYWGVGTCSYIDIRRSLIGREADTKSITDIWEDNIDTISADNDAITTLAAQLDLSNESITLSETIQAKLNVMIAALKQFEDNVVLFAAIDDGRFYSLKYCYDDGPSCWSKYQGVEYTFGIVEPRWSEYLNIFKIESGKVDTSSNLISEFGIPDFAYEEYNIEDKVWFDAPGWTAPFTCTLMHPDVSEICQAYSMKVGSDFTVGIQMISSDITKVVAGKGGKKSGEKTKKNKKESKREKEKTKKTKSAKANKATGWPTKKTKSAKANKATGWPKVTKRTNMPRGKKGKEHNKIVD